MISMAAADGDVLEGVKGRRKRPSGPVFPGSKGKQLTDFKRRWSSTRRRAKLLKEGVRFHDLRHTFCTRFAEANGDAFALMRIAGHRSIETTMGYVNATRGKEPDREAMAKLGEAMVPAGLE